MNGPSLRHALSTHWTTGRPPAGLTLPDSDVVHLTGQALQAKQIGSEKAEMAYFLLMGDPNLHRGCAARYGAGWPCFGSRGCRWSRRANRLYSLNAGCYALFMISIKSFLLPVCYVVLIISNELITFKTGLNKFNVPKLLLILLCYLVTVNNDEAPKG